MSVDNELALRREEAIKNDKAYGKTRLRDEFKVKPKHDAEPAYWYKNPYGRGELPCYRVADCIPIQSRSVKPETQNQVIGRKISGLKARLRSKAALASKEAALWLDADPLILDSETTGLNELDQIIELAICDRTGRVLFESRFQPTVDIEPGAYNAHGITAKELENEPRWSDRVGEVQNILEGKPIIIFNDDFDLRLLEQTNNAFQVPSEWLRGLTTCCAMYLSADFYGSTNRYGTISLADATYNAGVKWKGPAHSAVADTLATVDLVNTIAEHWRSLNRQLDELLESRNKANG